jgi:hypothetical protein
LARACDWIANSNTSSLFVDLDGCFVCLNTNDLSDQVVVTDTDLV